MKGKIALLSILFIISCNYGVKEKNHKATRVVSKINVEFYVELSPGVFGEHSRETIDLEKFDSLNLKRFVYKYKKVQERNDTLHILRDSVWYTNSNRPIDKGKLEFVSKKNYNNVEVKKYLYYRPGAAKWIFMNDSLGILIIKSAWRNITEYHKDSEVDKLRNQIINDTVFYNRG